MLSVEFPDSLIPGLDSPVLALRVSSARPWTVLALVMAADACGHPLPPPGDKPTPAALREWAEVELTGVKATVYLKPAKLSLDSRPVKEFNSLNGTSEQRQVEEGFCGLALRLPFVGCAIGSSLSAQVFSAPEAQPDMVAAMEQDADEQFGHVRVSRDTETRESLSGE